MLSSVNNILKNCTTKCNIVFELEEKMFRFCQKCIAILKNEAYTILSVAITPQKGHEIWQKKKEPLMRIY